MMERIRKASSSSILRGMLCAFTLAFYIGAILAPDLSQIFPGFWKIITTPAVLTKDYFNIGGISGTMLNYALVGTICCALMFIPGVNVTGVTVAGYGLTVGFCSYGMNVLNMLPFVLGVFVCSKIKRESFSKYVNFAMFSTALAPLVSEVLFRYPGNGTNEVVLAGETAVMLHSVTFTGVLLALLIGVVVGCVMPSLCAHAANFHKGYDLYNAGPAAGFLCFVIFAILYKTLGVTAPSDGGTLGAGNALFCNLFAGSCFVLCILFGFVLNGNSFKGYGKLLLDSGYKVDFAAKYGIGPCAINFGVYGLFILAYYNLIGATFTGPTFGAVWCMLAFCAAGSTPLNVLPIMVGYWIASLFGVSALNSQAIVVGLCFATGLAPVSGRYGLIAGIVASILHYCIVTSTPAIHGGFNLYNGGFAAGIVAFVFVPVLEYYFKTREDRKAAKAK